ncbi:ABC transporter ATP-binding protein [Clostridium minihomine]|uniref:ABC transporter ATP-binding protein n=1 Tax=Clostridium minihomine TaxID=2045012 RepID=UPI000C7618A2|nr:ABC transporter ATP-binding protein [Clostridium minihomine]
MREQKKPFSRLMELAGPHTKGYVLSSLLSCVSVAAGMIPYFVVAGIVTNLMAGETAFSVYLGWCAVAAAGFLAKILFSNWATAVSHNATYSVLEEIRLSLVNKLTKVPMGYVLETPSGKLKSTIVDRVESMEPILAHLIPDLTSNLLVPVFILIYLFVLDWRLALASLLTLPIGFLCYKGMGKGYAEKFQGLVQRMRTMNNTVVEYINGIEVIKAFNQSANSYGKYAKAVNENADYAVNWMKSVQWYKSAMFTIWPSVLVGVLPIGCILRMNGSLSVPNFITVIVLSLGIVSPILAAMNYTDSIAQVGTIVGEVCEVLDAPELLRPTEKKDLKDRTIRLENICFSYQEDAAEETQILKNINLTLPPHTITAFVGPSGGGKSTITKLIAGFWDVTQGSVSIGGADIRQIPQKQLMDTIAYVAQDNYLFDETVRENIRMGKPTATDDEVEAAAKACGCHDFIQNLENGYDTVVGGAGGHLSGGERQRIAITRAMLKDAPIVILDEATAYTDPESEAVIQESLAKLIAGKTVLLIAHRLSTVTDADQLVVVKQGQIEAVGTHSRLLNICGLYRDMWEAHVGAKDDL